MHAHIFKTIKLKDGRSAQLETARAKDARPLSRFRAQLHDEAMYMNASADEQHQSWLAIRSALSEARRYNQALYLLARLEGRIVGELQMRASSLAALHHDMYLALGLIESAQGLGIGAALLTHGIAWASAKPHITRLSLKVHCDNEVARNLYSQFDFVEEGRRKAAIGRTNAAGERSMVDEILMGYYLEPAA